MRIRIRHLFLFYGGTGMKKIIELKNITKSFDGEVVLDHIDLDIYDNEFLTLLGPSGCGKTTTLRLIGGFETADEGDIIFMGENINNMPPHKRNVNTVFQRYALFPHLNVFENVAFPLREKRVPKAEVEQRVKEMLTMVALTGFEHRSVTSLSGGQQQRVALARILVNRPRLLLLDEPFSALDSHLRDKLQMELRGLLADFGHDVLLVTHSRDEAYHLCRRVAVLERGRLLAVKATKALFADPGSVAAATLTGCKNIAPAHKTGEYEVEVPDWGIRLQTAQPVGDGVKAVGIRAHYFNTKTAQNRYPVAYLGEMEEPFEWIVEFRYEGQRPGTPPIWWRIPKDRRPQTFPPALGAAPVNVLLLYE